MANTPWGRSSTSVLLRLVPLECDVVAHARLLSCASSIGVGELGTIRVATFSSWSQWWFEWLRHDSETCEEECELGVLRCWSSCAGTQGGAPLGPHGATAITMGGCLARCDSGEGLPLAANSETTNDRLVVEPTTCDGGNVSRMLWVLHKLTGGTLLFSSPSNALTSTVTGATVVLPLLTSCIVAPPVVDIQPLLYRNDVPASEENQLPVIQRLLDAAQEVGYFVIVGCSDLHHLGRRLLRHLKRDALRELKLPTDAAVRNREGDEQQPPAVTAPIASLAQALTKITLATSTGHVKQSSNPPVYAPVVLPRWLSPTPEGGTVEALRSYYLEARRVALVLMEALKQDAIVPEHLHFLLRGVFYPPQRKGTPGTATLDRHTDKSWITLLLPSTLRGLQFENSCGEFSDACDGQFLDDHEGTGGGDEIDGEAPLLILVNIGDAFQMHTRGALLSRAHRAENLNSENVRVSVPLFVEPRPDLWPKPYERASVLHMAI